MSLGLPSLRFLLDENLPVALLDAIHDHNETPGADVLQAVRIGGPPDLPLGSDDPTILLWAEREGYVLLSQDAKSLPGHLRNHLATGAHSPGIFLIPNRFQIPTIISRLVLAAYGADPSDCRDCILFIR